MRALPLAASSCCFFCFSDSRTLLRASNSFSSSIILSCCFFSLSINLASSSYTFSLSSAPAGGASVVVGVSCVSCVSVFSVVSVVMLFVLSMLLLDASCLTNL